MRQEIDGSEGKEIMMRMPQFPNLISGSPKDEAAIKLQKVYKSFRTRRKLADCAVLIEQSWYVFTAPLDLETFSSLYHLEFECFS